MQREEEPLTVAVGVATAGRPTVLCEMMKLLARQTRSPDKVVVCAPTGEDVAGVLDIRPGIEIAVGVRGLPAQRNRILDVCHGADIVLFLDDDFVPDPDYLRALEHLHLRHRDVVMCTGDVVLDGVAGEGVTFERALSALADAPPRRADGGRLQEVYNGYGCNMSVRLAAVRRHAVRFDENLPLYGWLEDVDFSRALARYGRIVRSANLRGVHLGVKVARQPGKRLGYSQVANPIYICRKGNLSVKRALMQMGRNIGANLLRCAWPEAYVDRRGRVRGNILAVCDLLTGKLVPSRIIHL